MPNTDSRTIVRLRTYKDDFARAKASDGSATSADSVSPPKRQDVSVAPARESVPDTLTERVSIPDHDRPLASPDAHARRAPSTPQAPKTTAQQAVAGELSKVHPQPEPAPHTVEQTLTRTDHTPARTMHADIAHDLATIKPQTKAAKPTVTPRALPTNSIETDGSIVTDTKRKRFRLIPAIVHAFRDWLFEKKEVMEERARPQHTVATADTRADIIKRAAAGSALAPHDDHAAVRERLRHVPRTRTSSELVVKRADAVPQPAWTHTGDERASESQTETAIPTPEPTASTLPATDTRPPKPGPQTPPAQPESKAVPSPQPTPEETEEKEPEPVAEPAPTKPKRQRRSLRTIIRSYLGIMSVGVVATATGIGVAVWLFAYLTNSEPAPTIRTMTETYIDSSTPLNVRFVADRAAFLDTLTDARRANASLPTAEFVPRVVMNGNEHTASTEELRSTLAPSAPGQFVRAVHGIGIGIYRGAPFLVLEVDSFDTALGGMLAWERALPVDLGSFFGDVPRAETTYEDIVHANHDMRAYVIGGEDQIVYTFVDRSTILIATDRTIAADLAPLIR